MPKWQDPTLCNSGTRTTTAPDSVRSPGPDAVGCRACRSAGPSSGLKHVLERANLLGLRALGALTRGVLDPLVLLQRAVAAGVDGRVVDEDVRGAVVGGDEAEALLGVEPLDGSLSHTAISLM